MDKRRRFSVPAVGGSALLTMFAVLCLTVFALLSLSTALSGARLSDKAIENTENYYAASVEAEEIFARLRAGEIPDGVVENSGVYSYRCDTGGASALTVELGFDGEKWEVLRWQYLPTEIWESDSHIPVWKGE